MDRKEFLSLIGFSAVAATLPMCMGSCSKTNSTMTCDFTLDLTQSAYSVLNNNGGFLIHNGVIVAKTMSGEYLAVAAACTHEGVNVNYKSNNNQFICPEHGATFSSTGTAVSGPAKGNLQKMNTSLSGTNLRVYS